LAIDSASYQNVQLHLAPTSASSKQETWLTSNNQFIFYWENVQTWVLNHH
jgi:hypothetical protein